MVPVPWQAMLCEETISVRRKVGLTARTSKSWSHRCRVHVHAEQRPIAAADVRQRFRPALCHQVGLCICGKSPGSAPDLGLFWKNMEPWLRAVFAKKKKADLSKARLMTKEQRLVFGFFSAPGWSKERAKDDAAAGDDASNSEPSPEPEPPRYAYPAYMNFSNFHFTMLRLFADLEHVLGIPVDAVPQMDDVTQVTLMDAEQAGEHHGIFTDVKFVHECLDLQHSWQVRLFYISLDDRHWQQHDRSSCVIPLMDASGECEVEPMWIWRGAEYENAKLTAKRPRKRAADSSQPKRAAKARAKASSSDHKRRKKAHEEVDADAIDNVLENEGREYLEEPGGIPPGAGNLYVESEGDALPEEEEVEEDLQDVFPHGLQAWYAEELARSEASSQYEPSLGEQTDAEEDLAANPDGPDAEDVIDDAALARLFLDPDSGPDVAAPDSARSSFAGEGVPGLPAAAGDTDAADAEPNASANRARPGNREPHERRADFWRDELEIPHLGKLRYYRHEKHVIAVCSNPEHHDCRMTRTLEEPPRVGKPGSKSAGQGRPLGLMLAWLQKQFDYSTQQAHLKSCKPDLESRQEARRELRGMPRGEAFLAYERALRPGESEEPEAIR